MTAPRHGRFTVTRDIRDTRNPDREPHLRCICGWISEPINGSTADEIDDLGHQHLREHTS